MSVMLCIMLLFLCASTTHGSTPLALDAQSPSQTDSYLLGKYLTYWPDSTGDATLADARTAFANDQFLPSAMDVLSLGITQSTTHWFRIKINLTAEHRPDDPWQLIFDHDTADNVTLYSINHDGEIARANVNVHAPFYDREVVSLVPVINLPQTEPGEYELYVQVTHSGPALFPLKLSRDSARLASNNIEYVLLCFYYGAWLVMVLYNFIVYIGTRSPSYFYYVLYVLNIGVFLGFVKGLGLAFVIPDAGEWNRFLINTSGILLFVATASFIRTFLNTKFRTPTLDKTLFWLPLLLLLCIPWAGTLFGAALLVVISPITIVFILLSTCKVLLQGHTEARLFLVGWLCLITGICYQAFAYMGLLPWTVYSNYAIHIGSFVEIVLIALALVQQINTYKVQKEIAEKNARQQLTEKNLALQGNNKLKDEFIATISHELRTPLNGVVGSLELASSDPDDLPDHLNDALTSANNLGSIIDDILLLSETLSGDAAVANKSFYIHHIITKTVRNEEYRAHGKNINLCVEKSDILPQLVVGDPSKIVKVLSHLLSNAIKFSPPGNSVLLHFSTKPIDAFQHSLAVTISDTGIGIDKDRMVSIFDVFNQGDNSYRRRHGGLGIGLKLVHNITKLLDGEITIQSEPNKGTEILVTFPITLADTTTTAENQAVACKNNAIQKILVVEDNPVNQKILVTLLSKMNYEVDSAINGIAAVEKCEIGQYDLIFMDCQMPEMDGFEATERIRTLDNPNSLTTIIAVTANATEKDRRHCLLVGMDDFIKKPVRSKTIVRVLEEYSS